VRKKCIPLLLVLIIKEDLIRALIYKKIKGDFKGYVMGIWNTYYFKT